MHYKGTIFLEPRLRNFVTDRFEIFYNRFAQEFGYKLIYSTKVRLSQVEGDRLIVNNIPTNAYPRYDSDVSELFNYDKKFVLFLRDIHTRGNRNYEQIVDKLVFKENCLLMTFCQDYCYSRWKNFDSIKHVWFPQFYAPTERYNSIRFEALEKRKRSSFLIPGLITKRTYPLRTMVSQLPKCDTLQHPHYDELKNSDMIGYFLRSSYVQKLSEYPFCVTDSSVYSYMLAKHVEIPASSSLLVCNETDDLKNQKFRKNFHYVAIDWENYADVIDDILCNLCNYSHMAYNGMCYVRKNYNLENALIRFNETMESYYA